MTASTSAAGASARAPRMSAAAWRGLGLLLLATGTVLALLGAARMEPGAPDQPWRSQPAWTLFALGVADLCGAGLLLRAHAAGATQAGGPGRGTRELVERLIAVVRAVQAGQHAASVGRSEGSLPPALDVLLYAGAPDDHSAYDLWLKLQLDPILEEIYPDIWATREAFRRDHGLPAFARLFGELAHAERLLCRAWSAAVDGYTNEARAALAAAGQPLQRAEQLLGERSV